MTTTNQTFDTIVIGGGPSGLMASIAAAEKGANVLLIEKGKKLGKKLAISGGGRCNVTNRLPTEEVIQHVPGNGRFLYGPFSVFNNYDIIDYFEELGVPLKEEDHGRMFPVSDRAQDVVQALLREQERLGVTVWKETKVERLLFDDTKVLGVRLTDGQDVGATSVIVAVGGKAVPQTGSTGDGYPWAERAGHTVTTLYPTEVPLLSKEPFIRSKQLQGLALRDVAVTVWSQKGKKLTTHQMDMLFTHFGVSGPAILRCSQFVVKEQMKNGNRPVTLTIDSFPETNEEVLFQQLRKTLADEPKKAVKNSLKSFAQERWLLFLFERSGIDPDQKGATVSNEQLRALAREGKAFSFTSHGTQPIEKAFVTGGGVKTKELNPKTMESKLKDGLHFCGEVIDVHGYTGGYNITSALVTGRVAGLHAASITR